MQGGTVKRPVLLIAIGIVVMLTCTGSLLTFVLEPDNIWWTAKGMELPLSSMNDRAEVYINGKLLQQHVIDKSLLVKKEDDKFLFVEDDYIKVRVNNSDSVKYKRSLFMLPFAFGLGIGFSLFIAGLLVRPRREP